MPRWFFCLQFAVCSRQRRQQPTINNQQPTINNQQPTINNQQSYSLFELNEFIRQVLALNLSDGLWVRCELAQVKHSRGHCYLDVVEKSENGEAVIAQGQAVVWAMQLRSLRQKLGLEFDALLQEGMEVLMLVKVEFHERFGLKLMVQDFEPGYTLGKLALKRRETLLRLQKEGLLDKNKKLALPPVIQRVAILSSESAAGLKDFLNELSGNDFGYVFDFRLFPVAMQGAKVAEEVASELQNVSPTHFDVVAIIRGGGSKLDLAAFDEYGICKNISQSPLPVLAGIGHEVDETVLDKVVHTSLKTPTAVAGFIIHHNLHFESRILQLGTEVRSLANMLLNEQNLMLQQLSHSVAQQTDSALQRQKMMLGFIGKELPNLLKNNIKTEFSKLDLLEKSVRFLGPDMTLKRGFSITLKDGKTIGNSRELKPGDEIETIFLSSKATSIVKKTSHE